jgi:GTP-binding protein YchF
MAIKAGLVGLPNVGKSTLFNALTKSSAPAENYPFCTIDPHVAITTVPDERTTQLQELYKSGTIIPATVTFVDIAGLVKGAASGEGLGNQFLSHIREVDLILHVLRCFEDPNIVIHAGETIDPLDDYTVITHELMLKDLESIEKRLLKIEQTFKKTNLPQEKKQLEQEKELLNKTLEYINKADVHSIKKLFVYNTITTIPLLSAKKALIIANVGENELDQESLANNQAYQSLIKEFGPEYVIPVCAKIEAELTQMNNQEIAEIMGLLGMSRRGLDTIIQKTYTMLDLISFFTCGPKEIHVWPIRKGMTIRQASGEIHSDLERGFICAEIFNTSDLFQAASFTKLKETGKIRTEGQNYIVQDGDIVEIKFNV